jgi:hypothetical protein
MATLLHSIAVVCMRLVPARTCFFECVAEVRDSPKFFELLKIEIENYPIIIRMGMY